MEEVPFGAGKPYEETCRNFWAGLLSALFARETEVKPSIAGDFCNLEVHLKEKKLRKNSCCNFTKFLNTHIYIKNYVKLYSTTWIMFLSFFWLKYLPNKICRQFSIRISTITLANLMSIIAATVSSSSRSKVGPKQTPKLPTVIIFLSDFEATFSRWVHNNSNILLWGSGSWLTKRATSQTRCSYVSNSVSKWMVKNINLVS